MTGSGIATVARQEFRLRIRAGRWKVLLGVFFAVLVGFTVLLSAGVTNLAPDQERFRGTVLYGGLMLFVLGLALLVVPALAAQSVNGDRERGTLAVLQVTRLSAADIALGKLAAAWGTALVFLALTAPLVAYAMTQGGVPVGRLVVVTVVIALLLGTVCAISLFLSSVLARTTTSGVLAYLSVFGLTVGTLIVFGLATGLTAETVEETFPCPTRADLAGIPTAEQDAIIGGCTPQSQTYTTTRTRTDRTWFLLAPNPFVVLADAAPALPPARPRPGNGMVVDYYGPGSAADLDPLGAIGRQVRDLRQPPTVFSPTGPMQPVQEVETKPVWPYGLAVNVLLGVGAVLLTVRRLRTPSRTLPKGQRVA